MKRNITYILLFFLPLLFNACRPAATPKPRGYYRIAIPDTSYSFCALKDYPYAFNLSRNAVVQEHYHDGESYWIDILYPSLNATIHCSYKPIRNNFRILTNDAQDFLYSHSTVASAIPVQEFVNLDEQVYGLYYELKGNTATPIQFILTDSIRHFIRGSVYCNTVPNQDSLAPIYRYLQKDVRIMMETMKWQ